MLMLGRRDFIFKTGAAIAGAGVLPACTQAPRELEGGFTGIQMDRGHALRDRIQRGEAITPDVQRHARVVIAGGGIAGLSAARALRLAGVDDFVLLELEDKPGGNSRGTQVGGIACPQGAHYLPVPGDDAREVQDFLEELGLRKRVAGRWQYDEMTLCHSPQERLFFEGQWQEGLLPTHGVAQSTIAQYRRFAELIEQQSRNARFTMPAMRSWLDAGGLPISHRELDAITMQDWLTRNGLDDPHLRWYLDYCCRDDYGAGIARVSAWAGVSYFASRHGFQAPGDALDDAERDGVLTWPEGNGWLSKQLAAPLQSADQLRVSSTVLRIEEMPNGVEIDVHNAADNRVERWHAQRCIVALPVFIAARVVQSPPGFLAQAAKRLQWAPWLVANIHINAPLTDHEGAAPAWDNVIYADPVNGSLGYVDAGHQRLDPRPAPTVLSYYQALGDMQDSRKLLAEQTWQHWRDPIIASLAQVHPDLPERTTRMEITRYGHAMSIPVPGIQSFLSRIGTDARRRPLVSLNGERVQPIATPATARLSFAHADWSGYSVFEEAFTRGLGAAIHVAATI